MTRDRVGAGSVRWSPTGDRIAYLAQDSEKKAQIYVMPVHGGESVQVTHSKTPVTVLAWRPDGQALAYAAADEEPERKDEAKFEDAFEVGNNSYLERGAARPVHLWTVTLGGQTKRLTSGSWSLPVHMAPSGPPSAIAYTPDGRGIVFVKAESPITGDADTARVQLLDVATGAVRALTKSAVTEGNPVLSQDGTMVAYGSSRDGKRGNEETVFVAPVTGGAGRDVAAGLDRGISGSAWMPDGKALLVSANDGTTVGYWVQPLDGPAKRVAMGALCPSPGMNVGKDGAVALTATDATHPPELFYMTRVGDPPVQMTHLQTATDGMTLGRQETLTWKSDKLEVDGVLTYPPDYMAGKKYPMVLYIHGGPTATSLETFSTAAQILAAQGWLVLEPNYRGSNNEGNAFETAIVNDASAGPGRDIIAGVKAVEARGIVDEKRIAVSGWSYGGQMTAWMIGNYSEVWRAAVAGAPVTDLVDQYSLSDNNVERAEHYGPSPFVGDNLKSYAVQSPISYAWRVKAPTLIMSDVGDWRVTTTQAYKLFHALKDNGVTVKFVAFPVPGHSPADPVRSRDVWRRWTGWLAQYLNEPGATTGM
jgi:dipeptidyl aminopeptidase/acylaminoacyl peptidase